MRHGGNTKWTDSMGQVRAAAYAGASGAGPRKVSLPAVDRVLAMHWLMSVPGTLPSPLPTISEK